MEYLSLGKITGAFGLDGTLKVFSTTNMGEKRYKKGSKVFIYDDEKNQYDEYIVLSYRHNGLFDFVKLENINTPEEAISKKNKEILVIKNIDDLDDGTYFYSDLRGCEICDKSLNKLGIVKEIEEFPAQLTLRVGRPNKPDFFVPFIEEFIVSVSIADKRIIINVIEGLLWR